MLRVIRDLVAIAFRSDPDQKGHIIIPDVAKERSDQGIVKYIGPKCEFVLPGDYVCFSAYDGTNTHISEEEGLIIMPESKIVAIIHPPDFPISGLYFKYRKSQEEVDKEYNDIYHIIKNIGDIANGDSVHSAVRRIMLAQSHPFLECSYEQAVSLVRKGLEQSKWEIRWKDRMLSAPKREDL